jgi:hypothetical protein
LKEEYRRKSTANDNEVPEVGDAYIITEDLRVALHNIIYGEYYDIFKIDKLQRLHKSLIKSATKEGELK